MRTNALPSSLERFEVRRSLAETYDGQSHLIFEVDGEPYACPIHYIERLMRCADASIQPPLPDAPPWQTGRLLAEGQESEIPIVSLRTLWGLPANVGPADREALLIVNLSGQILALLVDACLSVLPSLPADAGRFDLPAAIRGSRGAVFQSAVAWQDSLLILLQMNSLLQGYHPFSKTVSPGSSTPS